MKPFPSTGCSAEHVDERVSLVHKQGDVPAIVNAFKASTEAASLAFSSAEAAHYVDNFLRSMIRVNVLPDQLGVVDVFDAILFVFPHDYVRQYRDRSEKFSAHRVLASLLAYFDFSDRVLHDPHAMAARHQIDFAEAALILASAVAQSHVRYYQARNRCWPRPEQVPRRGRK